MHPFQEKVFTALSRMWEQIKRDLDEFAYSLQDWFDEMLSYSPIWPKWRESLVQFYHDWRTRGIEIQPDSLLEIVKLMEDFVRLEHEYWAAKAREAGVPYTGPPAIPPAWNSDPFWSWRTDHEYVRKVLEEGRKNIPEDLVEAANPAPASDVSLFPPGLSAEELLKEADELNDASPMSSDVRFGDQEQDLSVATPWPPSLHQEWRGNELYWVANTTLHGEPIYPPIHLGTLRDGKIFMLPEFGGEVLESTFWMKQGERVLDYEMVYFNRHFLTNADRSLMGSDLFEMVKFYLTSGGRAHFEKLVREEEERQRRAGFIGPAEGSSEYVQWKRELAAEDRQRILDSYAQAGLPRWLGYVEMFMLPNSVSPSPVNLETVTQMAAPFLAIGAARPTPQAASIRPPRGLRNRGHRLGQQQGREFRLEQLEMYEFDLDIPRAVRGWLQNERRRVEQGKANYVRTPPGYELSHGRSTPAREGYDYSNSRLQGADLNQLEERTRRNQGRP